MVLYSLHLAPGRQESFEVALPAGGMGRVSWPEAVGRRPSENRFNGVAHSARGFRLSVPDGLDCLKDKREINFRNGEAPKLGIDVKLEGRYPLRVVFFAPSFLVVRAGFGNLDSSISGYSA
jgi:hypothetical protein